MSERVKPSTSPAGNAEVVPLRPPTEAETAKEAEENARAEFAAKVRAHLYRGNAILRVPPTTWLLPGVMPKRGLGALYSAPGLGKSHIAIHLAFEAATGGQFFGQKFDRPLRVLYVAAERPTEVRDRFEAQQIARGLPGLPETLALSAMPRPLQVEGNFEHLREIVIAEAFPDNARPELLIFDTFARMTLGKEENSSKELGPVIEAFGALVEECGEAFGLIVHHSGKDAGRGLRGSTALLGALDVVMLLEGGPTGLTVKVEKINAGPTPIPANFRIISQPIPDPADPIMRRNVGIAVPASYAEVASGIEAEVLEAMRDLGGDATAKAIADAYNEGQKETGKRGPRVISKALKHLAEQQPPAVVVIGKASRTKYRLADTAPGGLEGLDA